MIHSQIRHRYLVQRHVSIGVFISYEFLNLIEILNLFLIGLLLVILLLLCVKHYSGTIENEMMYLTDS